MPKTNWVCINFPYSSTPVPSGHSALNVSPSILPPFYDKLNQAGKLPRIRDSLSVRHNDNDKNGNGHTGVREEIQDWWVRLQSSFREKNGSSYRTNDETQTHINTKLVSSSLKIRKFDSLKIRRFEKSGHKTTYYWLQSSYRWRKRDSVYRSMEGKGCRWQLDRSLYFVTVWLLGKPLISWS